MKTNKDIQHRQLAIIKRSRFDFAPLHLGFPDAIESCMTLHCTKMKITNRIDILYCQRRVCRNVSETKVERTLDKFTNGMGPILPISPHSLHIDNKLQHSQLIAPSTRADDANRN